jgi:hypothetical protein
MLTRIAGFPSLKTLEAYDFALASGAPRQQVQELARKFGLRNHGKPRCSAKRRQGVENAIKALRQAERKGVGATLSSQGGARWRVTWAGRVRGSLGGWIGSSSRAGRSGW